MPEPEPYRTIAERVRVAFTVQGSEFIGHAAPTETVAEAEAFIDEIETEYGDATHNVPAYRVRSDPFREYASDDGEPSGSAGKPVLSVLQGRDPAGPAGAGGGTDDHARRTVEAGRKGRRGI